MRILPNRCQRDDRNDKEVKVGNAAELLVQTLLKKQPPFVRAQSQFTQSCMTDVSDAARLQIPASILSDRSLAVRPEASCSEVAYLW